MFYFTCNSLHVVVHMRIKCSFYISQLTSFNQTFTVAPTLWGPKGSSPQYLSHGAHTRYQPLKNSQMKSALIMFNTHSATATTEYYTN